MSAQAAKRYAKALFELADEKESIDGIHSELHEFSTLLEKEENIRNLFYSMEIQKSTKQQTFDELMKDKSSPYMLNFLKVVFEKAREQIFSQIIKEFDLMYDHKQNRVRATLVSAVALDDSIVSKVETLLSTSLKKTVFLKTDVDPYLLGGFQLFLDNEILDASLRRKLDDMKAVLQKSTLN